MPQLPPLRTARPRTTTSRTTPSPTRRDVLATGLAALVAGSACAREPRPRDAESLRTLIGQLEPLHQRLGRPEPGDWLASHKEPGQTFRQYIASRPVTPRGERRVIYLQPLGPFNKTERRIVALTAEFMSLYFQRPVKTKKNIPLSTIPPDARRVHPQWRVPQVLTTHVLDEILRPRLPKDAAAYLALTMSDLWPGRGWNFVFGQASLRHRVGVWSLYRNGDPTQDAAAFRLCLRRTLKTATHETGHMFSMLHCTAYECNMCGSNNRRESDRRPLYLGPQCVAKVCWATECDPAKRFRQLAAFCRREGLTTDADYYEKAARVAAAAAGNDPP